MSKVFYSAFVTSLIPFALLLGESTSAQTADFNKNAIVESNDILAEKIKKNLSGKSTNKSDSTPYQRLVRHFDLPTCDQSAFSQKVSLSHQEGSGVGFTNGYSTLHGFFSTNNLSKYLFFTDLRGHIFNDGKWAANAGIGLRRIVDRLNAVAGLNVFYDFREAPHSGRFHQIGPGLELLFKKWDVRANGYFTISKKMQLYSSSNNFQFFRTSRSVF